MEEEVEVEGKENKVEEKRGDMAKLFIELPLLSSLAGKGDEGSTRVEDPEFE